MQSMTNTLTSDVKGTVSQILEMEAAGVTPEEMKKILDAQKEPGNEKKYAAEIAFELGIMTPTPVCLLRSIAQVSRCRCSTSR